MSSRRRSPLVCVTLCLLLTGGSIALAGEQKNSPARPTTPTATTSSTPTASTVIRELLRPVDTAPGLSLPALLRLRWHLLLQGLAPTPIVPDPPVNSTNGLSDDPDPVGNTEGNSEGDDGDDAQRWGDQHSGDEPDPLAGQGGLTGFGYNGP